MKVLVAGGTGSVGLAIVEQLAAAGDEVVALSATEPSRRIAAALTSMKGSIGIEIGDVRDSERLRRILRANEIDSVVNGATITPDAAAEVHRAEKIIDVNCVGSVALFNAFADSCPGRFIQLGSIAAYGSAASSETLLKEDAGQERPETLYEITKFASERAVLRLSALRKREAVSLRLGDVFGRWEHRTSDRAVNSAPYQLMSLAQRGGEAVLPRPGAKHWVYSADIAQAVRCALRVEALAYHVANVSSPFRWSLVEWCELLGRRFPAFSFRVDPQRATIALFADNAPMALARIERIGYEARFGLEASFHDYLEWTRAHPDFFAAA